MHPYSFADHRFVMADTEHDKFLSERGFERVVEAGKPVFYNTPGPMPRILYKRDHVESYLKRENNAGRPTEVTANMFRFTKKRAKSDVCPVGGAGDVVQPDLQPDLELALQPSLPATASILETTVSRLAKTPGAKVNHRRDLCSTARELEQCFKKLNSTFQAKN